MVTTRTVQTSPTQSRFSGKWACTFVTYAAIQDGQEYTVGELETAAVWFDSAAALKAGNRALDALLHTGKYPNVCEVW